MSKMTSSSRRPVIDTNQPPADCLFASTPSKQAANSTRMLSDFSIDSIIGNSVKCPQPQANQFAAAAVTRKSRPKNFRCPTCQLAFSNNGQLKNHVRTHTGEKPFKCNYDNCNKEFSRNEELTRHKLIHSGLRPHACVTCGKRFGRKDHLKKHSRTHERKRLRKKVFVPTPNSNVRLATDFRVDLLAKQQHQQQHQQQVAGLMQPQIIPISMQSMMPTRAIVSSAMPTQLPPYMSPQEILSSNRPPNPAQINPALPLGSSTTLEQLASHYWAKWYDLVGFYHNQTVRSMQTSDSVLHRPNTIAGLRNFFNL